jgi:hypothetical protein
VVRGGSASLFAVAALTAVGLALRLAQLGQGLWGDELLAHQDNAPSFGSMMDAQVSAYALIDGEALKLGYYCNPEGTVVPCPGAR